MARVVLLYPPQQSHPEHGCKPEGALAYPSLGAALLTAGHDATVYDACVGNDRDDPALSHFHNSTPLPSGLVRTGVSDARILAETAASDIVGVTSIFTAQESMALHCGRLIRREQPDKILVAGGTNARSRPDVFLNAGFDVICLSEAEQTIVAIANAVDAAKRGRIRWQSSLRIIPGIAYRRDHQTIFNPVDPGQIVTDLDQLPVPAWELHPNDRYWRIGRPHGADPNGNGEPFRYASLMTSLGCVFKCRYCHISGEHEGSRSGNLAAFRVKSAGRVMVEFEKLKSLGVEDLFLEDDTLFGHKRRGIAVLRSIRQFGFRLWDINGINLAHLLRPDRASGRYVPDPEVLDVLAECNFTALSLPVESGNQRIIDQYASGKWNTARSDIEGLIRELANRGIRSGCNYMIGYPDETEQEIQTTIELARRHMTAGAASANFMLVIPLPGTKLHDDAIAGGYIDKNFDPDTFSWRQASMRNTTVPAERLLQIHQAAYAELNG